VQVVFIFILCGLVGRPARAAVLRAHYPDPPHIFLAGLRAGPMG